MATIRAAASQVPLSTAAFLAGTAVAVAALLVGPGAPGQSLQLVGLVVLVVVFGLPHGALDNWLARDRGLFSSPLGWLGFNLAYLGLAAAVVAFWWALPGPALAGFLLLSAWHFSGDWRDALPLWARVGAGLALVSLPALFHPEAVSSIFGALSGQSGQVLAGSVGAIAYAVLALLVVIIVRAIRDGQWRVVLELSAVGLLAALAPPLVFFALYFCLLHSPRHLGHTLADAPRPARPAMLRSAAAYTLATLVLAGAVAWLLWPVTTGDELVLKLVFIGLAALTVPHMLLVDSRPTRRGG